MRLLISFILLVLPISSWAFPTDDYLGFGMGYTWTEADVSDPVIDFGGEIETPTYSEINNRGLPWNIYLGKRFHPNYGVEVGIINYGSIRFNKTLTKIKNDGSGDLVSTSERKVKIKTEGFYISHVLFYELSKTIDLHLKAGVVFGSNDNTDDERLTIQPSDSSSSVQVTNNFATNSDAFAKAQLALGVSYQTSDHWSWQVQLNNIEFDQDTENEKFSQWFTNLSARYHF